MAAGEKFGVLRALPKTIGLPPHAVAHIINRINDFMCRGIVSYNETTAGAQQLPFLLRSTFAKHEAKMPGVRSHHHARFGARSMIKSTTLLTALLFLLGACAPGFGAAATTPSAPAAANTPASISTLPVAPHIQLTQGLQLGDISYKLPSTGRGWCLSFVRDQDFGILHRLESFCASMADPTTFIDLYQMHAHPSTSRRALETFAEFFARDQGARLTLDFVDDPLQLPLGPVQFAAMQAVFRNPQDPQHFSLAAFSVDQHYYLIMGWIAVTGPDRDFLAGSIRSLLDSVQPLESTAGGTGAVK